jgi:hypothetical protein
MTEGTKRSKPRVAAVVTWYQPRSHAENLVTKPLEGYPLFWTPIRPRLEVVSLYTDQVPAIYSTRRSGTR